MTMASSIALIINTHDQPEALARVLRGVEQQDSRPEEVVLADDGSGPETRELFERWRQGKPWRGAHAWQENDGFRRSRILNLAIAQAGADYLVFIDGDTIPHPRFISDHREAARPRFFVQGHRALIGRKAVDWFGRGGFGTDRRRALFSGQLKGWKHAFRWPFPLASTRTDLRGIRGCNLGIWRSDLVAVNGYNEAFEGWGREDSELAVRLMNSGLRRLDLRGRALCYHLWHPPASRSGLAQNDRLLEETVEKRVVRCERGLDQHLQSGVTSDQ
jgi:glycosyltransferase involved in cell wall biosynthesis